MSPSDQLLAIGADAASLLRRLDRLGEEVPPGTAQLRAAALIDEAVQLLRPAPSTAR